MVTQMMYLGLFFTFGVLFPEFEKEFGWSRAQISGASSTMFIVMGITFGLGSGGTALIAQFIGCDDRKKATHAAEHLIVLGIVIGIKTK